MEETMSLSKELSSLVPHCKQCYRHLSTPKNPRGGIFYMALKKFPGALFDDNGYAIFDNEVEYKNCKGIALTKGGGQEKINISNSISSLPQYKRDPRVAEIVKRYGGKAQPPNTPSRIKKTVQTQPEPESVIKSLEFNNLDIYDFYQSRDYFFTKEIITRYILSLKTKPFVILTGISGTGKTKIAQIFAEYMCQDEKPGEREKRIAFFPVRPDWVDNKGLLGFYNILDEKYHSTPFLNLLLESEKNPDKPYFVILDEMNLAKVEQYFSDFLSIMESRTADNKEGEKVYLHSLKNALTEEGHDIPNEIYIPSNVFFTGTVNVDETTYMFSPKVLDRANVIDFSEVDLEGYITGDKSDENFRLENPDVRNKLLSSDCEPFCSKKDYEKFNEIIGKKDNPLNELLSILKKYNLHFGYRVVNEISRFFWISKEFIEEFNQDEAIDIQILQKVLPKFHGTQGMLEEPLSDILLFCLSETDQEQTMSEELIRRAEQFDTNALFPRSAQKVARMISKLKNQGYTSFIE